MIGRERQEVGDDVEVLPTDRPARSILVANVGDDLANPRGKRLMVPVPPMKSTRMCPTLVPAPTKRVPLSLAQHS